MLTPDDAFKLLLTLPADATLYDLQARTNLPLALLYEWMLHYHWEERRTLYLAPHQADTDPQTQRLEATAKLALETLYMGLSGGGFIKAGASLLPRAVSVEPFQFEGTPRSVDTLTKLIQSCVSLQIKTAPEEEEPEEEEELPVTQFTTLTDEQLFHELQRVKALPRLKDVSSVTIDQSEADTYHGDNS